MQLVVMAAVLALAGAGRCCGCHLRNISIEVETHCNTIELIETTQCEGQCFNMDPTYTSTSTVREQKICNGDWSYEVKYTRGCPFGATYPVARNCECTQCNEENTDCGHLPGYMPIGLSF